MENTQQQDRITIEEPVDGYFILRDFPRFSQFVEDTGHLVAPEAVHIPPTIEDSTLLHIIEQRGGCVSNTPPKAKKKAAIKRKTTAKTKAATGDKKGGK